MTGRSGAAAPATSVVRGGAVLAGALAVANALGYALNLVASRVLGPREFGAFAALLGIVLVANVGALALQSVTARGLASPGSHPAHALRRLGAGTALAVGAALAAAAPLLAAFLHVEVHQMLLVAAAIVPMTLVGSPLGLAQGAERFPVLAALYVAVVAGKMGGALVGLAVRADVTAGLVGMLVGSVLAAAAASLVSHGPGGDPVEAREAGRAPRLAAEVFTAALALFAFFGLTNVDVLLARHHLPAADAGLYALGAVVAKGTFWFPQFVSVLAYPMLVDSARRARAMRISVAVVTAAGITATAGAALAPGIVVRALGGSAYAGLERQVWLFAAVGSLFALAQLLLYARLARGDRSAAVSVTLAVTALVVAVQAGADSSVRAIALTVCATAGALCAAGVVAERRSPP